MTLVDNKTQQGSWYKRTVGLCLNKFLEDKVFGNQTQLHKRTRVCKDLMYNHWFLQDKSTRLDKCYYRLCLLFLHNTALLYILNKLMKRSLVELGCKSLLDKHLLYLKWCLEGSSILLDRVRKR